MRVEFTRNAADELAEILDYIAERSLQGSGNVQSRIMEKIKLIADQPHAGRLVGSGRVRRISVTPYPFGIFYRVTDDAVEIIGVRHGARRPASMQK